MTKVILVIEFALLFFGLPLAYRLELFPFPMIPFLLAVFLLCMVILLRDSDFDRRRLWAFRQQNSPVVRILSIFGIALLLLTVFVCIFSPEHFLGFMRRKPLGWALVVILYPLLSVYPQSLIFRAFLFHRYRSIFRSETACILASAIAFSFMHLVFRNWLAVSLTFLGGLLFAYTYARTKSLFWTSFEHALYGDLLFTIGLGVYFYGGSIR